MWAQLDCSCPNLFCTADFQWVLEIFMCLRGVMGRSCFIALHFSAWMYMRRRSSSSRNSRALRFIAFERTPFRVSNMVLCSFLILRPNLECFMSKTDLVGVSD